MSDHTIEIRDIVAERGVKRRGFLKVGETGIEPIQIPVVIINGAEPGPILCITGGVHAAEYPALTAVMQTSKQLEPEALAGAVIAVPVVNPPMFQTRAAFLSPIDGLNLNRIFPGRPDGSISEVIAHTILTEVVGRATHHVDCHGGDLTEVLWPYSGYSLTGNSAQDQAGESMVRAYTPRIFALYQEGTSLPPTRGSLTDAASQSGVVSILAECGSAGGLDPGDVRVHMNGIASVMRYLKMIPGGPPVQGDRVRATGQFIVQARRGGLVRLSVGIGEELKAGQLIGEIHDVFGNVVETLYSPRDGIVRLIWTPKVVNSGDSILKCWTVEPSGPVTLEGIPG
jgi:uncharacterized protein